MKTKEIHILCRSEQKSEKMKSNLLFLTGCYPKELDNYFVNNSNVMPQNAANELSWRIIEGLESNIPGRFKILTCPFIGYYPRGFKRLFIDDSIWSHNGKDKDKLLGFVNLKGLETWIKSERIFKYIRKWYKLSKQNRYILIYSHYAGFMRAAGKIKRSMPDMHITCLVTDMPEFNEKRDFKGLKDRFKSIPRNIMFRTTYKNLKYISSFVLLTEHMKDYLKVLDRPYVVVEGIADAFNDIKNRQGDTFEKDKDEFRVVYTGTLHKRYGIILLLKAFAKLKKHSNITLYLCGSGDVENEVIDIANNSDNIHYLGVLEHKDTITLQASADLLVNPRTNKGVYTALSFPSKIMEYMIMGKPTMCYKLDGIPKEYDDYLLYIEDESPEGMAQKIYELSMLSKEKLKEIGEKNYQYAKKEKNPYIQVRKILDTMGIISRD